MKLSVVIVSYNVKYFLEQCLQSVRRASALTDAEVWVVDNNSADGSVDMVRKSFPEVRLIASPDNLGFSKANNLAIRQAAGEYILLLNPDTLVEEDTFTKVCCFMDDHPDAGGLGVYMIDGKGNYLPESKRGLPTPEVAFYKMSGLSRLFPKSRRFGRYHLGYLDRNETHPVEVLSGAFMLLRKAALEKTGLLDEDFFMYGEDIDLSYRITKAGYRNYYFPGTRIIHYKGESTRKSSVNYVLVFYNAMRIFASKHFSGRNFTLFNFLITLAIYGRAGLAIVIRILKAAMLPFCDAAILYGGLSALRYYWETVVKSEESLHYATEVQTIAFPIFVLTWILGIALQGGYERPVKLIRVFKGVVTGSAVILVAYSVLPEGMRFSRALVLLGSAYAIIALPLLRIVLDWLGFGQAKLEGSTVKNVAIAGTVSEFGRVGDLLGKTSDRINIVGRIGTSPSDLENTVLGSLERMEEIIRLYRLDEVIFCARDIPAHEIIRQMSVQSEADVDFKIAPPESLFVIGSNSINAQGELYGIAVNSVGRPSNRRSKRIFDILSSVVLLVTFPVHLLAMKRPGGFIGNIFSVLAGQKTWVGFNTARESGDGSLPKLRKGVIRPGQTPSGAIADPEVGERLDQIYARDYNWQADLNLMFRNYRSLGGVREPA